MLGPDYYANCVLGGHIVYCFNFSIESFTALILVWEVYCQAWWLALLCSDCK